MTLDKAVKRAQALADEKKEIFYVVYDYASYEVADTYQVDEFYHGATIIEALEPN